ncbi:hypothetical protein T492DRAFT_217043 [Pavlovales sp. CCMP2436]|nr:hypothetical protein T492DRAFT_217043 [Pavlovales sp. CCMP2436]
MRNAAIVAVALFAAAGHAPSAEAAAVAGVPMMWSNSGGGWRAMAASMGFSRAFDRAGLLSDPSLAKVASNSGGSWFLAQFAFSDAFYNSVVGETDLRKVVVAWMQKQAPLLRQPLPEILDDVDEWVGENIAGRLLKGVITALYKVRV